jgi:predicted site-specific integrase-resolvase
MDNVSPPETPMAHQVKAFCKRIGISPSTFWKYVKVGKIRVIRIGGRTLIPHSEATRLSSEGLK